MDSSSRKETTGN